MCGKILDNRDHSGLAGPMSITFKQLEAFVWVADLASFSAAAERLHTTQPNISARVAALEALVGATLFDRSSGKISPTVRGADLLEHARAVLSARDRFNAHANAAALTEGTLRLGVTEMIVHTWLRPFLQNVKMQFPKLLVELTVDLASILEKSLHDRQLDLALINGPFQFASSGQVKLGEYPMTWVAAPVLGLKGKVDQSQLSKQPILTHARGTTPYMAVATYMRKTGARLVPSSNLAACLQMTIDAMGVAALPYAMAERDIAEGRLVVIDHAWVPDHLAFEARFDATTAPEFVTTVAQLARDAAQAL